MKKTLIIGASENPDRYAFKAAGKLLNYGHEIFLIGHKKGEFCAHDIYDTMIAFEDVHTVTMYIRPELQEVYYNYILSLKPQRVIFNPGTENDEFATMLTKHNIEVAEECTLVMLSLGVY